MQSTPSTESILSALQAQGRGEIADLSAQRQQYLLLDDKYKPKDWNTEMLTGFVGRHELLEAWKRIEYALDDRSIPGLYLAGPPGAGKSSLMYFFVIKARRNGFVAPYIARCDEWCRMPLKQAKAYFMDIVNEACIAIKKNGSGLDIVPRPPSNGSTVYESWEAFANEEPGQEAAMDEYFQRVLYRLGKSEIPVILFFDEQNGLYEKQIGDQKAIDVRPFELARFIMTYKKGCVVLSGTSDTQFFYNLKGGQHQHIFHISCLSDVDFELWLDGSTQFRGPLADLYRHGDTNSAVRVSIRNEVARLTGRFPRELRKLCGFQSGLTLPPHADADLIADTFAKIESQYLTDLDARVKDIYLKYLSNNADRKIGILDTILDMCTHPRPTVIFDAAFLSLGLIYRNDGGFSFVTPTTRDVLLRETMNQLSHEPRSLMSQNVTRQLAVLRDGNATGGEKGYAFEKLFFMRMMMMMTPHDIVLKYKDLAGLEQSQTLRIRHQISMEVNQPPLHWKTMQEGTLVSHSREGEHRFDYIYYGGKGVTFLETTVSNYWETKIPQTTEAGTSKVNSILAKVAKWIGEQYFSVKVEGSRLVASPKPGKRKRTPSPPANPPTLRYIIVSPRPALTFGTSRVKLYGFIGLCHDSYLDASNLIPQTEIQSFDLSGADKAE